MKYKELCDFDSYVLSNKFEASKTLCTSNSQETRNIIYSKNNIIK